MRLFIAVLLSFLVTDIFACTGAKQMGMGMAGITVADNAHATYWNQALIPLIRPEISYTYSMGDVDNYRYDKVLAAVIPIGRFGVGYHHVESHTRSANAQIEDMVWNKFALGLHLFKGENVDWAIGGAVTEIITESYLLNITEPKTDSYSEVDVSSIVEKRSTVISGDKFRIGFLAQCGSDTLNLRPGASVVVPDKIGNLTLAISYYNFDNKFIDRDDGVESNDGVRFGAEQTIDLPYNTNLAIRAGKTHHDQFTYGLGLICNGVIVNYAHSDGVNTAWPTGPLELWEFGYRFDF